LPNCAESIAHRAETGFGSLVPIDVTMPRLTDSMDSATVARWLIADGEPVSRGDELVEIETDKATMVWEAEDDGTLKTVVAEGETVPVGAPIALLLAAGEDPPATESRPAEPVTAPPRIRASPVPEPVTAQARIRASPVARRLAVRHGVDLTGMSGTGPGGRVIKRDVEHAVASPPPARPTPNGGETKIVPLTSSQATIAKRMVAAKAQAPDFTVTVDVDMEAAVALRRDTAVEGAAAFSYNDLVIKACASALTEHRRVNSSFVDGAVAVHERIDIGIAVAAPGTLLVPTIAEADRKSVSVIAAESRELARRGRAGSLTPAEMTPGTFTISNLGMLGVSQFTAVLNAGQAAILAVGAVRDVPVVREGLVVAGASMTLTLTADHRVLYGADAAAFLAEVRALLEQPLRLLF
jgi:pyruvate dehydrogenase E2 component (dihydrolipoamide acetyltransferase)